jgi:hypothetical protein
MRRCLQTAREVLDTQEMKKRGVELFVRGDCREILDSQCDFPVKIKESMEIFSEFDFSHIKEPLEKYNAFFCAEYLENEKAKQKLFEASKKIKPNSSRKEIGQLFIDLLKEGYLSGDRIEKNVHVFKRVKKAKEAITKFVKEKGLKDGELVVVAHSRFSKAWTAKDVDPEIDEFVDYYAPKNCEVFESDI